MIEVKIPEDIISYQVQKGIGITNKQAIYVGCGLFIIIPMSILGSNFLHEEIVGWINMIIFILVCLPMVLEKNGISGEEAIQNIIYFYTNPQKRHYEYYDYESKKEIDRLEKINLKK